MGDETTTERMSSYEKRAWEQSLQRLHEPPSKRIIPQKVREVTGNTLKGANDFADEHLSAQTVKVIADKGLNGAFELTFVPALRSASIEGALTGYRKRFDAVDTVEDLKDLDVKELDGFRRHKSRYVVGSAAQGTAVSLVITGTTVSTTVSGGATAGVMVGAMVTDAVAVLALMGRTVGSIAVRYGYDVRLPEEELFAMGVISMGTASGAQARYAALASLSRLTQQMMRRATWDQLNKHVLVKVLQQMFKVLGLRLTHRKLAQAVPVAGVAISGALNASLTKTLYQRAEDIYRVRFLTEKYGLDTDAWLRGAPSDIAEGEPAEQTTDMIEMLEAELEAEGYSAGELGDGLPG